MRAHDVERLPGLNCISIPLGMLLLIYPLLWIWQGLDFTDTGFWLTNYRLIFTHPESVSSGFLCYLSEILGGAWLLLWGEKGLIGARLGYAFVVYLTISMLYYTLRDEFEIPHLMLSLLVTLVFITRQGLMIIGYNNLTALFYVVTGGFLFKGIKEERATLLFCAGVAAICNIFVRLPNIAGLLLFLIPLLYRPGKNLRSVLMLLRPSLWGGGCALIFIVFFMLAFDHLHIYAKELGRLVSFFQQEGGQHSGGRLFGMFIEDHKIALNHGLFICILYAFLYFFCLPLNNYANTRWWARLATIGSGIAAGCYINWYGEWMKDFFELFLVSGHWTYTGVLYIFLIVVWFLWTRQDSGKRLLLLISIAILVLCPLGSGNGIRNSVYGMWLAMPVAACALLARGRYNPANVSLITLAIIFGVTSAWSATYRDSDNRREMLFNVDHPALSGIYTTRQRARVVQELLDKIPAYVDRGEELLAVECIPLLYSLTGTRPYLNSAWPLNLTPEILERQIRAAPKTKQMLPPVVKATLSTKRKNWPKNENKGLISRDPLVFEKRRLISNFIETNKYRRVWHNSSFEIWMPHEEPTGETFYRFDYTMADFRARCSRLNQVSGIDWHKLEKHKNIGVNAFKKRAQPFAAIQGVTGNFDFSIRRANGSNKIKITPAPLTKSGAKYVLQLGPRIEEPLPDILKAGNLGVFHIRARSSSNKTAVIFIHDQVQRWEGRTGAKMVFGNEKWQELFVFKAIRPEAKSLKGGIYWRPGSETDYLEIEEMEMFVCDRSSDSR